MQAPKVHSKKRIGDTWVVRILDHRARQHQPVVDDNRKVEPVNLKSPDGVKRAAIEQFLLNGPL